MLLRLKALKFNILQTFALLYEYVFDQNQITLPYPVNEDEGRAQFDKSKRKLIVTLPVIPAPPVTVNGYVDGEAAENMVNGLVTEIVDDKDDCELNRVVSVDGDKNENGDSGVDENDCDINNAAHDSDGVSDADVNGCKDVVQEQFKSSGKTELFYIDMTALCIIVQQSFTFVL